MNWFNDAKGFGFIRPDAGGGDLFVHYRNIVMAGRRTLVDGQKVTFEVETGPKGRFAVNVRPVPAAR